MIAVPNALMEKKLGLVLLALIALFAGFIWWDGKPEPYDPTATSPGQILAGY